MSNPLEGIQKSIENISDFVDGTKNFFKTISNITDFINKCFTEPNFLIDKIQMVGADTLLFVLLALIILRWLGFEGTTKYIALSLVIAVFIAML